MRIIIKNILPNDTTNGIKYYDIPNIWFSDFAIINYGNKIKITKNRNNVILDTNGYEIYDDQKIYKIKIIPNFNIVVINKKIVSVTFEDYICFIGVEGEKLFNNSRLTKKITNINLLLDSGKTIKTKYFCKIIV